MKAQRRHVAERNSPFDRAAVQIQRDEVTVRRLQQRQSVHELGVRLADPGDVRIHFRRAGIRARSVRFAHAGDVRLIARLEEEHTAFHVEGRAAPVRAANQPGPLHGAAQARWREQRTETIFLQLLLSRRLQLRRQIERIVERGALLAECRWPGRERLRGPGVLALDVARWHRTLFDRPYGSTGRAIEHERKTLFRELDDGINLTSGTIGTNRDKVRRRRVVVVPQPVMHDLIVPSAHAGVRIETDERFGKKIGAGTTATVEVVARRAERDEHEAALGVERHRRPGIRVSREAP